MSRIWSNPSYILQDRISQNLDNFYYFCLNSEQTTLLKRTIWNDILDEANPNYFFNFFCIYTVNFTWVVASIFLTNRKEYFLKVFL